MRAPAGSCNRFDRSGRRQVPDSAQISFDP
jgi:hypothetical protein